MLKALELNGFKSFADRTRFEFPEGITAVVGPNGSGKSNIVDAVKWVLGTQSAKALRGKEMTDVIFSGARSRGQTNAAEVTLVFDNTAGVLDVDSDEVHITRRVYRSGEGEYLINRQPSRLRDIRDVFAGTGVAGGAYSIIEQGKVDALLQSSPRDRRVIFEEAAGVSRFKLKRQEAARRLERVDQNLLRLADIVDELDARLRTVRSQAGRARKYKEHSDRLKRLRVQLGLYDYRRLTGQLHQLEVRAGELEHAAASLAEQAAASDQQLADAEEAADSLRRQLQQRSDQSTAVREQIAQNESTRRSQLARCDELAEEAERLQKQLLAMNSRAGNAQQMVAETAAELERAEEHFNRFESQVLQQQQELDQSQTSLAECRDTAVQWREQHTAMIRQTAELDHRTHLLESQRAAAESDIIRYREQLEHATAVQTETTDHLAKAEERLRQAEHESKESNRRLTAVRQSLKADRQRLAAAQTDLADLRSRLSGARERSLVLEELERRLDGISSGAKEALRLAREQPDGPLGCVRGIVADLLRVDADTASLVEIALSEKANHLLIDVATPEFFALTQQQWSGRTSFLRLDVPVPGSAVDRIDLSGEPGVVGRADSFVETAPDLALLPRRLLGRYWFVDNLQTARRLAEGAGRGLNYVTVVGEVLAADGTLVVGPRQANTGLLSRRSELRALLEEIEQLQQEIEVRQTECSALDEAITTADQRSQEFAERHETLNQILSETRLKAAAARERLQQAQQKLAAAQRDLAAAQAKAESSGAELANLERELAKLRDSHQSLESSLAERNREAVELEQQVAQLQRRLTDQRVELARGEQRRNGLRRQMEQFLRDHQEHDRALADTRRREVECRDQRRQLQQSVLDLTSQLAELYHAKQLLADQSDAMNREYGEHRSRRAALVGNVDGLRRQFLERQNKSQQAALQVQQLRHQRDDVTARLRDDYNLELPLLATIEPEVQLESREQVDVEIAQLRQQLQAVGPVNLKALSELEAVEDRHSSLSQQYHDLKEAKARLEQLVNQINAESRGLFVESLEVIRGHFQQLYSSLFGGGEADIVVDDSETDDVLECGIEIIARPPGKQPRSISLLSGGERTMTCVALLLAIFRSRPSPFCVLDEVDAALDEANIERFVGVLKEFLGSTQFIVVTHSKRTMSCADTMYGITMQESGVSKRVAVRFEDDVAAEGSSQVNNSHKAA